MNNEWNIFDDYDINQLYMIKLSLACQNQDISGPNGLKKLLKKYDKHCNTKHFLNVLLKDSRICGADNVSNVLIEHGSNTTG